MEYMVEMKNIKKSFGNNNVLKGVDFYLEKGSIHALLGENGTGKTTLMNILGNILPKDSGTVIIDNKEVNRDEEREVAFIHQELALVNDLSIYENLFLGREEKKGIFLDQTQMINETQKYLTQLGIELDPRELVRNLNPSYKQITEILRAVMKHSKVIIMDEPTTSLTDVEIQHIFEIMRTLKNQGISLIFISHKLNEVLEICDNYTIMRDGEVIVTGEVTPETTELQLSRSMVGKELSSNDIYRKRKLGDTILEVENLSRNKEYESINLNIKKGEIVGVTGLLGDGRSELFATIAGANYPYQGSIKVNNKNINLKNTTIAKQSGISYVPKNRKENGVIKDLSIKENMLLPILKNISQMGLISKEKSKKTVDFFVENLNIKIADDNDLIGSLSGGNQQKVVLAKALCSNPNLVILDNPTQGVDIGAKQEIYKEILILAEQGISFFILSSEISEIQRLCDRVYVLFHGKVQHEFLHGEISEGDIMFVSTGGKLEAR